MLMAAEVEVPRHLFIHGFLLMQGEKMSKSLGNVLDPFKVIDVFGTDALRYYCMREVKLGQALSENNPEQAERLLGDALALWRGTALAEFSEPFARHESARLEELRIAAREWRIDADLALGHHRDVVSELEVLIAEHPLRERLRSQHMLALYRSGRHAEALAGYQAFRRRLADELGIEPSASLRDLERLMLQQDPPSIWPPPPPARRGDERRAAIPTSPTPAAATSGSLTRSSATARSTSFSYTAGSAPSSPAGSTRSWPASTGDWRRWDA